MSDPLLRRLLILQRLTVFPNKITAGQLKVSIEKDCINVSLRTVQRDLIYLSGSGIFAISCDQDTKPVGWYWVKGKGGYKPVYNPVINAINEAE